MNIFSFSRPSILLLHYGLFAMICHVVGIFLMSTTFESYSAVIFESRVFPMLEHSLISVIGIFIGVLGLEYINKQSNT